MNDYEEPEVGAEHADCCGCGVSEDIDELYFCNGCGQAFCATCWGDHRRKDCCGATAAVEEAQA